MRDYLQYLSWVLGFSLILLVIAALLRGSYRRYPFIFVYAVALFLTSVADTAAAIGRNSGVKLARTFASYYWMDQGVREVLLFAVVIALLYQATRQAPRRAVIRTSLVLGAILFAAISFLVHYDSHLVRSAWMTPWIRDLDLCAAILDLALWTILLKAPKYDMELFMLSGALGILFTGEAIGYALRNQVPQAVLRQFPAILLATDLIIVLASSARLYIWWQVFRTAAVQKPSPVSTTHL